MEVALKVLLMSQRSVDIQVKWIVTQLKAITSFAGELTFYCYFISLHLESS